MTTPRRSAIKKLLGTVAAITTLGFTGKAESLIKEGETIHNTMFQPSWVVGAPPITLMHIENSGIHF